MLRKSDIEQAAHYLVAQRGECAEGRAKKRAQELAREGNREAALIWQLIAGQISAIHNTHRPARLVRGRLIVINGGRA
ncbi:MAG: hypothetical protein KGL22_00295 [Alphaproteobacteria bacterium]|nr:hypothetical protein [Alphaproteobacteria bacterium]